MKKIETEHADMWQLYRKYFALNRPYIFHLLLITLADLLVANFGLVVPLFSQVVIDFGFATKDLSLVNLIIGATILLYSIEFVLNIGCDYITIFITQSITTHLTKTLFMKWQTLKYDNILKFNSGDIIIRLTDDIESIAHNTQQIIPRLIVKLYCLIAILIISFAMNATMTILALCSIPIYILEIHFFTGKESKLEEETLHLHGEYISSLNETIDNIKLVKSSNYQEYESEKILKKRRLLNINSLKQGLMTITSAIANSFSIKMWTVILTWYMSYLVIHDRLTIGEIVALITYFAMMDDPIKSLTELYHDVRLSLVSMKRIDDVMQSASEANDSDNIAHKLAVHSGSIQFHQVNFRYTDSSKNLFDNLNIKFESKKFIALVGDSGSGKSTLINMILGFHHPTHGSISIDDQDLATCHINSIRKQIALVQQQDSIFKGSIRENLLYGNNSVSDSDLISACQRVSLYDWIEQLPDKLNHQIVYNGDNISAGQKQRLAIARALLKKTPIIILDEATSALDAESEYHISEILNSLHGKVTLIVIAHRINSIKKADVIFMMEDGKVVETGNFEQLMELKNKFFTFHHLQFGGFKVFKQYLEMEYDRVRRYNNKFTLLNLKVNSQIKNGDEKLLKNFTIELRKLIRKGDQICQFDLDHILILLPEIASDQIELVIARLRKQKYQDPPMEFDFKIVALHITTNHFQIADDILNHSFVLQKEKNTSFHLEEF